MVLVCFSCIVLFVRDFVFVEKKLFVSFFKLVYGLLKEVDCIVGIELLLVDIFYFGIKVNLIDVW